ncbi:16289_t:CDS:2 [Rhizophagus irregularis]|nr:16289_t:CDS:2 [Rhizophagus irregularis]
MSIFSTEIDTDIYESTLIAKPICVATRNVHNKSGKQVKLQVERRRDERVRHKILSK